MFGFKAMALGIAAIAIVTIIGLAYNHYNNLLKTINVLEANNAKLEVAHELQQDTILVQEDAIASWKAAQELYIVQVQELQNVAMEAAKETDRLNALFSEHDLTLLAQAKPGLIETIINNGTDDAFSMLKCASGAKDIYCAERDRATASQTAVTESETD